MIRYTLTLTLFAAAFLVAFTSRPVIAADLNIITIFQPRLYVEQLCGDEDPWGCVTFQRAVDNPLDVVCYIHVPVSMTEVERGGTILRLRPRCLGNGG